MVTPGETVDMVVTERGICVNPLQKNLEAMLIEAGLKVVKIEELEEEVRGICGEPKHVEYTDKIVGLVEYRDGTIIDVIHQVKSE